jgi:rhodanese-related sulfurtransferase
VGIVVLLVVLMALFMFWGAEQLERIVGTKDLSKEPKLRVAGAGALFVLALAVVFIGTPSLEERYSKLTFTRTETIPHPSGNAEPIVNTYRYSGDQMLEERLVQITPAEMFKTIYNQNINLIMLDVRPESDFNLYHIKGALNVPLDHLSGIIPDLLTEPPANSVFVLISNDETTATQAWKQLVASSVPNAYILEGGVNNWIAFFGKDEGFQAATSLDKDQLGYIFPAALGSRYESCDPDPIKYEELEFEAKIQIQLKRDKSGGGCG